MKNIDKDQGNPDIYRVYKLLKKIRIRTDKRNEDFYTTNKKKIKMTMKITKGENILENQETNIEITINTTFRSKSLIDYRNRRLGLYNRNDVILRKRITDIHVKKDDDCKTKLRDYGKENVYYCTRDQTVKKVF